MQIYNLLTLNWILFRYGDLVAKSYLTLATPWTVTSQVLPFMGFPRQEYWSGLLFPSPGVFSHYTMME